MGHDFYDRVVAMMSGLTEAGETLTGHVKAMQNTQLTNLQKMELATTVVNERLKGIETLQNFNMNTALKVIREGDFGDDLYTVMNVIQEKIIRGGIKYTYEKPVLDQDNNVIGMDTARSTTRAITNISTSKNLNQFVFDEALKLVA